MVITIKMKKMKTLKFLNFTYLIFSIILFSYLIIFEIRDIVFPNGMKPLRPIVNYDDVIYYFTITSILIRIFSITSIFLLIYFNSSYETRLKETILNSVSAASHLNNNTNKNIDITINNNILNRNSKLNGSKNVNKRESRVNEIRDEAVTSLNNHDSNFTTNISEDKNLCEETSIRISMDELNEKIKAGEIFSDNKSSRASNINTYNLII